MGILRPPMSIYLIFVIAVLDINKKNLSTGTQTWFPNISTVCAVCVWEHKLIQIFCSIVIGDRYTEGKQDSPILDSYALKYSGTIAQCTSSTHSSDNLKQLHLTDILLKR